MARLTRLFGAHVGDRATIWPQNPSVLDPHWEPRPDLVLLRPRDDFYATAHPRPGDVLLVVGVAEPSRSPREPLPGAAAR